MSGGGKVGRKVRLSWREWSMDEGSFWAGGGNFGGARTGKSVSARAGNG